jgi:hypothetical protein
MQLPPAFYLNSHMDAGKRNEFDWRLEQAGVAARRFPGVAEANVARVVAIRQVPGRPLHALARNAPATYARALGLRP